MKIQFVFSQEAKKDFGRLDSSIQKRVQDKLASLKSHPNIFEVLGGLRGLKTAKHRLRIGNYRLLLRLEKSTPNEEEFWVLRIRHRREAYR